MAKRKRSAQEWARLIREWRRSGETAARFAKRHGFAERTLIWWAWRLKHSEDGATTRRRRSTPKKSSATVQLVPVEIGPAREDHEPERCAPDADLAWELASPSGHILRVYGREAVRGLDDALAILAAKDRRQ